MKRLLLVPLLLAAAIVLAVIDENSGLPMWLKLRTDLENSNGRIARLEFEITALQEEVYALESSPFALERAIREDLEFARPGETVIRFIDEIDGLESSGITGLP